MKLFYFIVYWVVRVYFKIFYRLKIYGLKNYKKGAAIIAANHVSFLDPPAVSISCPEEVHFLAKASLFKIPILSQIIRQLNTHPVAKDAGDIATFHKLLDLLKKEKKIILFPEGSRSLDGNLTEIERGISFLTLKAKCRIQPVYLYGTHPIWPRNQKYPHLTGKIKCVFGSPIEWSDYAHLDKKEAQAQITLALEHSLHALKSWVENGAHGTPP